MNGTAAVGKNHHIPATGTAQAIGTMMATGTGGMQAIGTSKK